MPKHDLEQQLLAQGQFLRVLANQVAGDGHQGDDLLQEAWLRSANAPVGAEEPWLRTVLRNLGLNKRRSDAARSNRERRVAKAESLPSAAEEAERAEYLGLVAHAVQTLPEPYRAVVLLRYWDGLAPREIARMRNVPVATIKTQLQRGLERLRVQLDEEPPSRLRSLLLAAGRLRIPLPYTMLMQTQVKLLVVALAVGALGVWGLLGTPEGTEGITSEVRVGPQTGGAINGLRTELETPERASSTLDRQLADLSLPETITIGTKAAGSAAHVQGRVLSDAGVPLAAAHLSLSSPELVGQTLEFPCGSDGRYHAPSLARGTYSMEVGATGYLTFRSSFTIKNDQPRTLPDVVLRGGRTLRGRVVEPSGVGIPDAEVLLLEQTQGISLRLLTTTDGDGIFTYDGLPMGDSPLAILAKGWTPARVVSPSLHDEEIVIELTRGWQAHARIMGLDQAPWPLRLHAYPAAGSQLASDEGDYEVHTQRTWPLDDAAKQVCDGLVRGQPYYLSLEEEREPGKWLPCSEVATIKPERPEAVLAYHARATLLVQTLDSMTGLPLPAQLEIRPIEWTWRAAPRADDGGVGPTSVEVEPDSMIELRARAAGYAPALLGPWSLAPGSSLSVTVKLTPVDEITLLLQDAANGHPLAGVHVHIAEPPLRLRNLGEPLGKSGPDGQARIHTASELNQQLLITGKGYCQQSVALSSLSHTSPNLIELDRSATATIQLCDEYGTPVPGAAIEGVCNSEGGPTSLRRSARTTDIDGRMTFYDLPPGEYEFFAARRTAIGRRIMLAGALCIVSADEDDEDRPVLRLTLASGDAAEADLVVPVQVTLRGQVMENSTPVGGAQLHWLDRELGLADIVSDVDLGPPDGTTSALGEFMLQSLASGKGTLVITHLQRPLPYSLLLDLTPELPNVVVNLPVGTLTGQVRNAEGAAINGVNLRLTLEGPDGPTAAQTFMVRDIGGVLSTSKDINPESTTQTERDGSYTVRGVPPDYVVHVEASAPGYCVGNERITVRGDGPKELDFTLQPAGHLTVGLTDSNGEVPHNCAVRVAWKGEGERATRTLYSGMQASLEFDHLAPGPWEVSANALRGDSKSAPSDLHIAAGAKETVNLTIQ